MFEKLLIAVDPSEASDRVVECLGRFRQLGTKKAVLMTALGIRHLDSLKFILAPSVEPYLVQKKQELEKMGFKVEIEIGPSDPSFEINRIADVENVDLIVIGSHGKGLWPSVPLGGEATKILHTAKRPVLVIRIQSSTTEAGLLKCEPACLDFSKPVLYATDFSDIAQRAFTYVEKIVESGCRKVTLIHVQDRNRLGKHLEHKLEEFNRIDQERLEMLRKALLEKGAADVNRVC